jgi:hypothetical protein
MLMKVINIMYAYYNVLCIDSLWSGTLYPMRVLDFTYFLFETVVLTYSWVD